MYRIYLRDPQQRVSEKTITGDRAAALTAFANLVNRPNLQQPGTPYCAVAIHPSIAMYTGPVEWLGDFERCVAWAWITRNPDLRAAT